MILRAATFNDEAKLLEWRNDPDVRAYSSISAEIHPAEHHAWLAKILRDDSDAMLFVAEVDGVAIGQGRVERAWKTLQRRTDTCVIGYSIAKEHRGKKHGKELVRSLVVQARAMGYQNVSCRIKRSNLCSVYIAIAAGVNGIEFF